MFHGLMFAVKYNKQFAMFLIPERENKALDFLKRIELPQRVITSGAALKELYDTPIDYAPVNEFIRRERKASEDFLENSLTDDQAEKKIYQESNQIRKSRH